MKCVDFLYYEVLMFKYVHYIYEYLYALYATSKLTMKLNNRTSCKLYTIRSNWASLKQL